jgi:glutamate 5-kinase
MSDSQTLVVKLGTSVLTGGSRRLNRAHIVELVRQCAQLHAAGHRIVIVTSGAIAAGREHLVTPNSRATIASSCWPPWDKADSFNSGNSCSLSMAFTSGRCC